MTVVVALESILSMFEQSSLTLDNIKLSDCFALQSEPSMCIEKYIYRLVKYIPVTQAALTHSAVLLKRLGKHDFNIYSNYLLIFSIFRISMKMVEDYEVVYEDSPLAAGCELHTILACELGLLERFGWNVHVSIDEILSVFPLHEFSNFV